MDLKRLRTFVVVADLGTVSKGCVYVSASQLCRGRSAISNMNAGSNFLTVSVAAFS
jgi:hypothetical protein